MCILPIEIIKQIFDYLPIPTDDLLGKGDGGAKRWKELKHTTFYVGQPLIDNGIFDELEVNQYHKAIQKYHHSFESLLDSYHRAPFYPDGLNLKLDPYHRGKLFFYEKVMDTFELITPNDGPLTRKKLAYHLYNFDFEAVKMTKKSSAGLPSGISGSYGLSVPQTTPKNGMRLKELTMDYEDWNVLWNPEKPDKVTIGVDKLTVHFNRRSFVSQIILDLTPGKPEELEICSLRPFQFMHLKLPETLKSLSIQANVSNFYGDLPSGLEAFTVNGTRLSEIGSIPLGVQELHLRESPGSLSRFSSLKSITLECDTSVVINDLPESLEELVIGNRTELSVDLTKFTNLRRFDFYRVNIPQTFRTYELIKAHDNSFTFKHKDTLYSIPVPPNLRYSRVESLKHVTAVCYPQSLRYFEIKSCGFGLVQNLPTRLDNLRLEGNQTDQIVRLPSELHCLEIIEEVLKLYKYEKVKHLSLVDCDIGIFEPPQN